MFPSIALFATTMVDFWMSKSSFDTFATVINFINEEWMPCHVVVGMFEALNTFEFHHEISQVLQTFV